VINRVIGLDPQGQIDLRSTGHAFGLVAIGGFDDAGQGFFQGFLIPMLAPGFERAYAAGT
jgi:hypothetical protein